MLPRTQRLRHGYDIRTVRGRGVRWNSPFFLAFYRPTTSPQGRLGIIVSGKIGKAVIRKRASRVLSAAYVSLKPRMAGTYDIVLIARPAIVHKTTSMLIEDMARWVDVRRL
jgi:ribonuclease P protein component